MALIVCDHARSGTTLLRRICQSHPQISLTKELGNFAHVGSSFPQFSYQMIRRWYYRENRRPFDPTVSNPKKRAIVRNAWFITRFLLGVAQQREYYVSVQAMEASLRKNFPQSPIVGDKLPHYVAILPHLVHLEGLKIIVIYRDCRDVTSSFLIKVNTTWRVQKWTADRDTAEKIAGRWVQMINIMETYAEQVHIIRYENLIKNPQETMAAAGQWLDVDPRQFSVDDVRPTSIGNYKRGLSSSELDDVLRVAGPTMARLGYI